MRERCAVLDCKTGSDCGNERVTLFPIPKNKLVIWQKALPYIDKKLTHRDVICEKHFRKSDIIRDMKTRDPGLKKPKLAPGAVPSVFRGSKNKPVTPRGKKLEEKIIEQVSKKAPVSKTQLKAVNTETFLDPAVRKNFNKKIQELRLKRKSGKTFSKKEYDELVSKARKSPKNCQYDVVSDQGATRLVDKKAKSKFYAHDGELFDLFHHVHVDLKHADGPKIQKELNKKYKNIAYGDICAFVNLCPTCSGGAKKNTDEDEQTQNGSNSVGTPLQVNKRKSKSDKNKSGLCKNCDKKAIPQFALCPGCKLKADVDPSLDQLCLYLTNDRSSRSVGAKLNFQTLLQRERAMFKMSPFLSKEKYDELLAQVKEAKAATDKKQFQLLLKNHDTVELEGVTRLIRPTLRGYIFKYYLHLDELYDILQYTHLQLEHGSWQKIFSAFKKVFVNVTFRDIVTYLSLCETCSKNWTNQSSPTK